MNEIVETGVFLLSRLQILHNDSRLLEQLHLTLSKQNHESEVTG